jgi:outer membrane protein OmpA-like peptidoglycan-associated protein
MSIEPALLVARAQRVLAVPASVTLSLNGDKLVGTGSAPASWVAHAESLAPAIAGIGSVDFSRVSPGLPAELGAIVSDVESAHAFFAAGSDSLDAAALATTASVAKKIEALVASAAANHYDVTVGVVGRADPSGAETDNLSLSRRRALTVRERLVSLGVRPSRLTADGVGSNDPLTADSPAERARLNRSASFVVRAQPTASVNGAERSR